MDPKVAKFHEAFASRPFPYPHAWIEGHAAPGVETDGLALRDGHYTGHLRINIPAELRETAGERYYVGIKLPAGWPEDELADAGRAFYRQTLDEFETFLERRRAAVAPA